MIKKFSWPPKIEEMGEIVKNYIDSDNPLSIADRSGIYETLENNFANLHNRKYGLLVSSGTMALYSSFYAIGLKPGDEVISTVYTYHATAAPLLHLGVNIVFCDVEPDTGNIDVTKISELITSKTKAIVTNDQWGHPVDKDEILSICKKYKLRYIEDCSHAHFSEYKGHYSGTFGDIACWSFQGNKLLSGGEGGILLTDNRELYEQSVLLGHNLKRPFDSVKNKKFSDIKRTGLGLKLRIHPLAALMVNHQLENYCFDWIKSRNKRLQYFNEELKDKTPMQGMIKKDYVTSMGAWYGFKPLVNFEKLRTTRIELITYMQSRGFDVKKPGSVPLTDFAIFEKNRFQILHFQKAEINKNNYPNAYKYYNSALSIPTFTFENDRETIDQYVHTFSSFFNGGAL